MEKWDYTELSKNAKDFGGPEKFVEFIENSSRQKGRGDMLPWIGVTALGTSLLTLDVIKIRSIIKAQKSKNDEQIETIKEELIEGIKEYEANYQELEIGSEVSGREISQY